MIEYVHSRINGTYDIVLPDFRHIFHSMRERWEKGRLESCHELMKPGMTIYDIGAECGDFTSLYRSWVGDDGLVIPVEPAGHQWPFIAGTWAENGFIDPPDFTFVGLVSDSDVGTRPFDDGWPDEAFGEGIPDGGFVHLKHSPNENATTIDQLAVWSNPDAIVIDIEGSEWHALNGARGAMERCHPMFWVSVHDVSDDPGWPGSLQGWYGKTVPDIHDLMSEYGYTGELLPSFGEAESFWLYR